MITIDQIDFTKLKPFDGKVTKCFEQLCYQIAIKEYGHLGEFTPIDGSGGDGGVEFFLKHKNGETWGWQCKFFGDTGRLNIGNRKPQIENALETACRNHKELTKWFLCLKTDLTANSNTKTRKFQKGEQDWFEKELPKQIPTGRTVKLFHRGESRILRMINSPKNYGIRSFFFGDLEFNPDWFKSKFEENFEAVKDKYDPELHSIDKYTKSRIDFILFDSDYCKHLEVLKDELQIKSKELHKALIDFRDETFIREKEQIQRENYFIICSEFQKHIAFVFEKIEFISQCIKTNNDLLVKDFSINSLNDNFFEYFNKIDYSVFEKKSTALKEASSISHLISEFGEIYNRFFGNYFHEQQKELNFLADAAKGKTHISCDIAYNRIKNGKPVVFITGEKFSNETNLLESINQILDIDKSFTFDEFINSLDVYGSIVKSKIPIIIDGLNETTHNRFFSPIWKNHIKSFSHKISQTDNIILITTCRNSYSKRIWDDTCNKKFHHLDGFRDNETIREAVYKYFKKYKLKADLFFAPLEKFKDPIFLKIFCEIKNPNWKLGNDVEVNIEEESIYDVFKEYLTQVNQRVTKDNHLLRNGEPFITESLALLSDYLWQNNLREIPTEKFYNLLDGSNKYEKDESKADILINEGLVVTRDMREKQEFVSFTYDILAGYIIGENLIKHNKNLNYFISKKFIDKIYQDSGQHPLFEDIITSLCLLLPQLKKIAFHDLLNNDKILKFTKSKIYKPLLPKLIKDIFTKRISFSNSVFNDSVVSLFKLPAKYVKEKDTKLLTDLFFRSEQNQEIFFDLSFKTLSDIQHPLNALFFSKLLEQMPMNQRDISWTEYVRQRFYDIQGFIQDFEEQCKILDNESEIVIQKIHVVSKILIWFLTSTNRSLRDCATRALYYYGRRFQPEFTTQVFKSLRINDPYVWERTLASLYGVTMAEHCSYKSDNFRNNVLPDIGIQLYNLIFKKDAPYSTTHILARDYARRTIEIALLHSPKLFSESEIEEIRPPYSYGGIRDWGEFDYGDKEYDYSSPIHMDFTNYTIGRIVKDGHSYSNPPEKIKVRKQIYWRIYDLGWDKKLFKDVENFVANSNYYKGRLDKPKVERYGKKYSWIAYYENAGLRYDLGLIKKDWDTFRISDADIDPSFPEKNTGAEFIKQDLLGDRSKPLEDWYEKGGMPFIEKYLSIESINGEDCEWICLDAFITQEDIPTARRRFTFIRSFLIKDDDYKATLELLKKQNLGCRWLPEKHNNYYSYAGELYYCPEATYSNYTNLEFITSTKKVKVKKGEPGYFPSIIWNMEDDKVDIKKEFPEEIEIEGSETKKFEVLMPVMEYNWEGYHSSINEAGHSTVLAKELAKHLNLLNQPQTFDLFEPSGKKASINIYHHKNYNNNHSMVYLRKDLLEKFMKGNNYRFIWAIWGEREISFKSKVKRNEFFKAHKFKDIQVFQKIVEYERQ